MTWERRLLEPDVLALAIPIVLIIVFATTKIIKSLIVHRERMAMIEHGIHPDFPPEDDLESRPNDETS